MMRALLATILVLFGLPQGAAPNLPGAIEGRVIRTSTSEPISGVQIVLVPAAPPASAQPLPGQAAQPAQQVPLLQQGIQVIGNPDGSRTIQNANGAVIAQVPQGVT